MLWYGKWISNYKEQSFVYVITDQGILLELEMSFPDYPNKQLRTFRTKEGKDIEVNPVLIAPYEPFYTKNKHLMFETISNQESSKRVRESRRKVKHVDKTKEI